VRRGRALYAAGDAYGSWEAAQEALAITRNGLLPGLEAAWLEPFRNELQEHRLELLETVDDVLPRRDGDAAQEVVGRHRVDVLGDCGVVSRRPGRSMHLLQIYECCHGQDPGQSELLHRWRNVAQPEQSSRRGSTMPAMPRGCWSMSATAETNTYEPGSS